MAVDPELLDVVEGSVIDAPTNVALREELVRLLFDAQEWERAEQHCETLVVQQPANAEVRCLLAQCRLELADAEGGLAAAADAAALDPDLEWPHRLCSVAFLRLGRLTDALVAARRSASLAPASPWSYLVLVDAEVANDKLNEAWRAAVRAVELAPDLPAAHSALGGVELERQLYAEAEAHFRRAFMLDPRDASAANDLGVALSRQGRKRQAVYYFTEASRLNPEFTLARTNAVRVAPALPVVFFAIVAALVVRSAVGVRGPLGAVLVIAGAAGWLVGYGPPLLHRLTRDRGNTDPKASRAVMKELRREAVNFRGPGWTKFFRLSGIAFCSILGAPLFVVGAVGGDTAPARAAELTVGTACAIAIAYLARGMRRAGA
jgi:tetratricopeptide (TPR) repeat protein